MIELKGEKYFTVEEVANSMKVSRVTVRRWCTEGILTPSRLGKRLYISETDLKNSLEKGKGLEKTVKN